MCGDTEAIVVAGLPLFALVFQSDEGWLVVGGTS